MKQSITCEQIDELTDGQKLKLWEMCKNSGLIQDSLIEKENEIIAINYLSNCIPLLSIGQMFELLIEKGGGSGITDYYVDFGYDGELCDHLWQEVKEYL
jgi:hypothetical protein